MSNPSVCGCFGLVHDPLINCLTCGRIACKREGYNPCAHCKTPIMNEANPKANQSKTNAEQHKDRLLQFDQGNSQRTQVFDAQADYFSNTTSMWLTTAEQDSSKLSDVKERATVKHKGRNMNTQLDLSKLGL